MRSFPTEGGDGTEQEPEEEDCLTSAPVQSVRSPACEGTMLVLVVNLVAKSTATRLVCQ